MWLALHAHSKLQKYFYNKMPLDAVMINKYFRHLGASGFPNWSRLNDEFFSGRCILMTWNDNSLTFHFISGIVPYPRILP